MRRVWRMMIVPSGSTDRHGHTTSRQHDEGDVHDDGQARDSTNEIARPMCDSTAYSHTRFIRRPSSFVHSTCSGCNRKRCSMCWPRHVRWRGRHCRLMMRNQAGNGFSKDAQTGDHPIFQQHYVRGAQRIMAAPIRETVAPMISQWSGRMPSTTQSHPSVVAI